MKWPWGGMDTAVVALVNVTSSSISAGYALLVPGTNPHIIASIEYPLDEHATEPKSDAIPRVLSLALDALIRDGAPKLLTYNGHARVKRVILGVSAPWHTHAVSIAEKHEEKPFPITENLVSELLKKHDTPPQNTDITSQNVISTYLNGYEAPLSYKGRASSLQIVALTSYIDSNMHACLIKKISSAFHTKDIETTSFSPEFFFQYKLLYPHQRDYVFLDIGSESSDLICVKHSLLVASKNPALGSRDALGSLRRIVVTSGTPSKDVAPIHDSRSVNVLVEKIHQAFTEIAHEEPLPHLILYAAPDTVAPLVEDALNNESLHSLWITREPRTVQRLSSRLFADMVTTEGTTPALPLYILALSARRYV